MNHLQKAWLKVLGPVVPLINDKLAKRSGILGKIGKFWAIGPRQFGYHPTSKWLAMMNQILMQNIPFSMHRHSFLKYPLAPAQEHQPDWLLQPETLCRIVHIRHIPDLLHNDLQCPAQ